jgi:hypothetical protein
MGLFDTVIASCPYCGNAQELQSKGGPCDMSTFKAAEVPPNVAQGLVEDEAPLDVVMEEGGYTAPHWCAYCGAATIAVPESIPGRDDMVSVRLRLLYKPRWGIGDRIRVPASRHGEPANVGIVRGFSVIGEVNIDYEYAHPFQDPLRFWRGMSINDRMQSRKLPAKGSEEGVLA